MRLYDYKVVHYEDAWVIYYGAAVEVHASV